MNNKKIEPYFFREIGKIHNACTDPDQTPRQPCYSTMDSTVEIYPEFVDALNGIENFSHIILIFFMNQPRPGDEKWESCFDNKGRGLFASRSPIHPNRIGLSTVRLLKRENNLLYVANTDMLDNTSLLDIKPYMPSFDSPESRGEVVKTGWYVDATKKK